MAQSLTTLPLLFSFKQIVGGAGFFAGVRMNGRCLLEKEQVEDKEEAWITGIAPVGIVGGGEDRNAAFAEFRNAWIKVLFDIAAQSTDFAAFSASCSAFLGTNQESLTKLWTDAVAEVRKESYVDPSLHREVADHCDVEFEVADLTDLVRKLELKDVNVIEKGVHSFAA